MIKKILWGLVFLVSLYVGVLMFINGNQRNMQYKPGDGSSGIIALSEVNLPDAKIVTILTTQYLSVRGWYQAPIGDKPLILYFKGNEGSFTEEYARFEDMVKDGYGFLAFDYRGFPMSPGRISQDNILHDALAVFDWAESKGHKIILFGRSLGTGPATYVAANRVAYGLILETPFTSASDVAAERYPLLPVSKLIIDSYKVSDWIVDVDEPLLVAHGSDDKVIPLAHGEKVFALANNPQKLWTVEGGTHGSLWNDGLWDQITQFVEQ